MKEKANSYTSTEKALKILLSFAPQNQEMGTLELSNKLGIHKSTLFRKIRRLGIHLADTDR